MISDSCCNRIISELRNGFHQRILLLGIGILNLITCRNDEIDTLVALGCKFHRFVPAVCIVPEYLVIASLTEASYLTVRNKENLRAAGRSGCKRINIAPRLIGIILVVIGCIGLKFRSRRFMSIFKTKNIEFTLNIERLCVAHILLCTDFNFRLAAFERRLP